MSGADIAALMLRIAVGGTIMAHGWNHAFGGGKLPGTARWFESIGIRPGRVHALMATVTELGAGALLVLGLLTPLAAGAVVGTMLVALVANHLRNGFFIFRPGEGYEYVLMISLVSIALGALGGAARRSTTPSACTFPDGPAWSSRPASAPAAPAWYSARPGAPVTHERAAGARHRAVRDQDSRGRGHARRRRLRRPGYWPGPRRRDVVTDAVGCRWCRSTGRPAQ